VVIFLLATSHIKWGIALQHIIAIRHFPAGMKDHFYPLFHQGEIDFVNGISWFVVIRQKHTIVEE
jgi:hypothetical protein